MSTPCRPPPSHFPRPAPRKPAPHFAPPQSLPPLLPSALSALGQGTAAELSGKDFRAELEAREADHLKSIGRAPSASLRLPAKEPPPPPPPDEDDDDDDGGPGLLIDPDDADDQLRGRAAAPAEESDDDDDDDDDDEEELMRELERIKKERAAEAARKEREAQEEESAEHESAVLQGNPLLDPTVLGAAGGHAVKRRWDDDVVFKNQAREPAKEARRFINDTVRNDFHRRFLNKYIK